MKLILRQKHSTGKKSNTTKPKKSRSNRNMAKKKSRKSTKKSSSGKAGLFSGKVLGFKIPMVDKVIKNKTLQKVMVASGAVTTIGALVSLINNQQVNKVWSNPLVQDGAALATGDVVGAIGNRVIKNPQLISQVTGGRVGGQSQQSSSQAGFA
jgi:hypothetical protein